MLGEGNLSVVLMKFPLRHWRDVSYLFPHPFVFTGSNQGLKFFKYLNLMNRNLRHMRLKSQKTFPFNHSMALPKLHWLLGRCISCPTPSDDSQSGVAWASGSLLPLFFSMGSKGGRQDRARLRQRAAKMPLPPARRITPRSARRGSSTSSLTGEISLIFPHVNNRMERKTQD